MKTLQKIRTIEQSCYPEFMWGMQDCSIEEYAETTKPVVVCSETAYFIASDDEIVDLAGKVTASFIKACFAALQKEHEYHMDCRAITYKYLCRLHAANKITIVTAETWDWDGEEMVAVTIVINNNNNK